MGREKWQNRPYSWNKIICDQCRSQQGWSLYNHCRWIFCQVLGCKPVCFCESSYVNNCCFICSLFCIYTLIKTFLSCYIVLDWWKVMTCPVTWNRHRWNQNLVISLLRAGKTCGFAYLISIPVKKLVCLFLFSLNGIRVVDIHMWWWCRMQQGSPWSGPLCEVLTWRRVICIWFGRWNHKNMADRAIGSKWTFEAYNSWWNWG